MVELSRQNRKAGATLFAMNMPGKTQGFHEHIYTTFQLRDFLSLSLKFLVFRPGNRHRFRVACLQIIFLFHEFILPYFLGKVQKNLHFLNNFQARNRPQRLWLVHT